VSRTPDVRWNLQRTATVLYRIATNVRSCQRAPGPLPARAARTISCRGDLTQTGSVAAGRPSEVGCTAAAESNVGARSSGTVGHPVRARSAETSGAAQISASGGCPLLEGHADLVATWQGSARPSGLTSRKRRPSRPCRRGNSRSRGRRRHSILPLRAPGPPAPLARAVEAAREGQEACGSRAPQPRYCCELSLSADKSSASAMSPRRVEMSDAARC